MQPFIIMTDYAEVNTAVESMKLGSIDYIPKQLVEDKLVPLIRSNVRQDNAVCLCSPVTVPHFRKSCTV